MHDTRAVNFVLFINNCVQSMGGQIDLESVYSTNLRTLPIISSCLEKRENNMATL